MQAHQQVFITLKRVLSTSSSDMTRLKSVFIDLSGTLHVDNDQTPGAAEALKRYFLFDYIVAP